MKALVGAFNQEKALVGAFSVIVQWVVEPMDRFAALIKIYLHIIYWNRNMPYLQAKSSFVRAVLVAARHHGVVDLDQELDSVKCGHQPRARPGEWAVWARRRDL